MDYSINNYSMLKSFIGEKLENLLFQKVLDDCYWEHIYFTINDRVYDLSNSNQNVELYNGTEEMTILNFLEVNQAEYGNSSISFDARIKDIILTNEVIDIESIGFHYVTSKAITFVLEDVTITLAKDSWVDEGIRIICGNEWKDKLNAFHSNYFDDDNTYDYQKSTEYIKL